MIDTKELRRLAQEATPGPWYIGSGIYEGRNIYSVEAVTDDEGFTYNPVVATAEDDEVACWDANARLIAAANPAVISELLDRLEAAEADALEQARLNGMGSEREAALMAKLEAAEKERDALRAKIEAMERQEPVGWQTRTRPAWNDGTWGAWRKCSEEYAEDIKKTPLLYDWLYEARALYALPGAKALLRVPDAVMAALDNLDDYIARIEGNDRGACNHINLLRRYLLDAADVGENK